MLHVMNLQVSDALVVIGQIAVSLAGFAGLIVTMRNRGFSSWPRNDIVRLQYMLIIACSTFFAALIPYLVSSFSPTQGEISNTSAAALGVGLVLIFAFLLASTWSIRHQMVKFWWILYLSGTIFSAVILLACVSSIIDIPVAAAYLTSLLWMLFFSTTLFVRLILTPPDWEFDSPVMSKFPNNGLEQSD